MNGLARVLALALGLACAACTTHPLAAGPSARPAPGERPPPALLAKPPALPPGAFRVAPGPVTVEDHPILRVYDGFRPPRYSAFVVRFPGSDGEPARAHFLVPPGPGPHPAVILFPILGGSHVVSEAAAKVLVRRGYAVLRVERRRIFPRTDAPEAEWQRVPLERPARILRGALLDGRRLLDWLETRPEVDPERLAAAGVSIGGIMAATLMGVDERIRAGVFVMAGGGLPELLWESSERPLVRFRSVHCGDCDPEDFLRRLEPLTRPLDPLSWAHRIDPAQVVLVSGRFDRVVPPQRTAALWQALGRPRWHRYPGGHYQIAPFFWWALGRGADHLDRVLAPPDASGSPESADASTRERSRSRSRTRSPASGPGEKPRS